REKEIERVMQVLSRRTKNNPVLIGEPGVGKTAVVEGLAGALCGALVQTAADPAYLGRVTSVSTLFTYAVIPLSYPVTGAAVALWGTGPVYTVSAAVCAAGGVLGLALTVLRRAELPR
ncbi:hypothetical protein AB0G92_35410, partial [Streptomyces californicus]